MKMEQSAESAAKVRVTPEMVQIVKRADEGDLTVMPLLKDLLDKHPQLVRAYGDLGRSVENKLLAIVSKESLFVAETIRHHLEELRAEVAGPAPSSLEKLLVNRIGICWLQVHLADLTAADRPSGETSRRQNAAQSRYLAAIRQLALVRQMLRRAPSTLDLLKHPVNETSTNTPTRSPRDGLRLRTGVEESCLQGAGVEN